MEKDDNTSDNQSKQERLLNSKEGQRKLLVAVRKGLKSNEELAKTRKVSRKSMETAIDI